VIRQAIAAAYIVDSAAQRDAIGRGKTEGEQMRAAIALPAIALLAAGCGGLGTSSPAAPPHVYVVSASPTDALVSIWQNGGMVPLEYQLTRPPVFEMYGDGRILVQDPKRWYPTYDRSVLPPVDEYEITPAEIQLVLRAADAAGLMGPTREYRTTQVTDQDDTYFRTAADGTTHQVSAYGLELTSKYPSGEAADLAAAAHLLEFFNGLLDLPKLLGRAVEARPYQPSTMLVLARRLTTSPSGAGSGAAAWPSTVDPASGSDYMADLLCLTLTGADLAKFSGAVSRATVSTVWSAPSGTYNVWVRPQYPGDTGCPG
jgi:hypothetical protein